MSSHLPSPTPEELERSASLQEIITDEMRVHENILSFAQYMQMCLYTPDLGYYTGNNTIFGEDGDFVTSSEFSNHFANALVSHLAKLQQTFNKYTFIEIGAGSGEFSHQVITTLIQQGITPSQYQIVEISPSLQEKQQQRLQEFVDHPDISITWSREFDQHHSRAVVFANEVIDALPVQLVCIDGANIQERCVTQNSAGEFEFCLIPADEALQNIVRTRLPQEIMHESADAYYTEVNTATSEFVKQIATSIDQGIFIFVDYGYPRTEYYHPQRTMGTLLCHYRHTAHANPLQWPGLQDISCNVEFTGLVEAGVAADLTLNSYGSQAGFLLVSDYLQTLQQQADSRKVIQNYNQLKNLIMPSAMGERFQIMGFSKNLELPPGQFVERDLSYRL